MNRRTPRRRISPRTVRRYRAIKNFMRRAFGSSSQPLIKSKSAISVSVVDLKRKIDGIEQQLKTVSKHCQDLASLESKLILKDQRSEKDTINIDTKKLKATETRVLYKPSQNRCDKPINIRSTPKIFTPNDEVNMPVLNKMLDKNYSYNYREDGTSKLYHRLDPIKENEQSLGIRKNHMASRTLTLTGTAPKYRSYSIKEPIICNRHLDTPSSQVHRQKNRKKMKCYETNDGLVKLNIHKGQTAEDSRNHKNKHLHPKLNEDFIADIIRRQYKPVKLFSRRESDLSQFSAPVCRDQELSKRETVQGSDLCSCCHEGRRQHRYSRYMCSNDPSDVRSICDTRLYSCRRHENHTNHKKHANHFYNDSAIYDIIPVKEKSSPKTRRKFAEDNILLVNSNFMEVPPSPRTQRPLLNLQTQFYPEDDADGIPPLAKQIRQKKKYKRKSLTRNKGNVSNISSEVFTHNRSFKGIQNTQIPNDPESYNEECVGTLSIHQYPTLVQEHGAINNDTTLQTQTTDVSADKTDKTLTEIRDMLQSFLQEIKKESSQSENYNSPQQITTDTLQNLNETQQDIKSNAYNNNSNLEPRSFSPFMQSLPNSCCCPIIPVYPINCMQNGFVLPSQSFTCATCSNNFKKPNNDSNDFKNNMSNSEHTKCETQKLIKEIHNLISQNPNSVQKMKCSNHNEFASTNKDEKTKTFTSSDSPKASKHDAKVGTTRLKYHSKSCEAIGTRETIGTRHATNVSYSDTVLEKGSGEEITTDYTSGSEYSSESIVVNKKKGNRFLRLLRSIGILRRNKTDVIEQVTDSGTNMDIGKPKQRSTFQSHAKSPFQQHIINYNMHGQEYFDPPVRAYHQQQYGYFNYPPHYNPKEGHSPPNVQNKGKNSGRYFRDQNLLSHCTAPRHIPIPTCLNYYDPYYVNLPPQVPVCLKEIEVKNIGTQSIRKISLLQKLTHKMQVPVQKMNEPSPNKSRTQTSSKDKNSRYNPLPSLLDWKNHGKSMQTATDPHKFSYKSQKILTERDNTMRNAMLKKLFYKKNPFSPRNLLVRSLLKKDKSNFGEPLKSYKPRMFL